MWFKSTSIQLLIMDLILEEFILNQKKKVSTSSLNMENIEKNYSNSIKKEEAPLSSTSPLMSKH